MKKLLIAVAVVAVLVLGGLGALFAWAESAVSTPKAAGASEDVELAVPKGATGRSLGKLLEEKGLIDDARVWRWHLWRRGGLTAKTGRHKVKASMTMAEISTALEANPLPEDQPFAMIEGWRLVDTDAALSAAGYTVTGEYVKAASDASKYKAPFPLPANGTLEGYLYPETYRVVPDEFDVKVFIQRQLDTFAQRFYSTYQEEIGKSGRTLHEIVTMASLLEREEPVPAQRALVAGILWKRIDKGFPLGVDATSRYQLEEWNDRKAFLVKLRDADDPYNSRLNKGLPPTPIGAPTVHSLLAALRPEKSEYWYYLHDSKKKLHPSKNAEEHDKLRAKFNVQ
jgi:UPF0755 protein